MGEQQIYCALCGAKAIMTCIGCGSITYCTTECLEADERAHKSLCGQVTANKEAPKPNMRRGILLPENEKKPRFEWYPLDIWTAEEGDESGDLDEEVEVDDTYNIPEFDPVEGMELADVQDLLNGGNKSYSTVRCTAVVQGSFGGGLHLDKTIYVAHRDGYMGDVSRTNQCLEHLTRGRSKSTWRGPLLLHGMTKVVDSAHCVNLGVSDLMIGIEALLKHKMLQGGPSKVKGVKVNASPPFFEEVKVPIQHPVFYDGAESSISKKIRIPLRTYLYHTNNVITNAVTATGTPRIPAAYLHGIIDAEDSFDAAGSDIGAVSSGWLNNTRSVLLVKTDSNDPQLSAKSAKAICMFAHYQMEAIRAANTSPETAAKYAEKNLTKQKAMQMIMKIEQELDAMEETDFASDFEKLNIGRS